ncbi:MAG: hypothetical protein J7M40_02070 [Planctomycetes bacterium]|nr:hypothetical protein [Planctomycetota bacterium]
MAGEYRFSFGPWNIHEGGDPFGPTVRGGIEFAKKLACYKQLGFDGVQFHDDDAVPDMNDLSPDQISAKAADVKKLLDDQGFAESTANSNCLLPTSISLSKLTAVSGKRFSRSLSLDN